MKLHSFERGTPDAPSVILIHGLLGASRNLLKLQDAIFRLGFHTLSYDQRGHGHSEHGPVEEYDQEHLCGDLIQLMDEHKIERAHLVGHSLGGRVSLLTAARAANRVCSLTMLDVGPRINENAHLSLRGIIEPLPMSFPSKSAAVDFFRRELPLDGRMKILFEQFLLSNLRDRDGKLEWVFDLKGIRDGLLPLLRTDNREAFRQIRCPILAARGENSEHFTQAELDEMKALNPNVRTAIIPNSGHWVHVDNYDGTYEVVSKFLLEVAK